MPTAWSKVLYSHDVEYDDSRYPIGWNRNMKTGRWWYQYGPGDDDYYRNGVFRINDACYAFGPDGYMKEGRFECETDENGEIRAVF
jgi:hypothetical protein